MSQVIFHGKRGMPHVIRIGQARHRRLKIFDCAQKDIAV